MASDKTPQALTEAEREMAVLFYDSSTKVPDPSDYLTRRLWEHISVLDNRVENLGRHYRAVETERDALRDRTKKAVPLIAKLTAALALNTAAVMKINGVHKPTGPDGEMKCTECGTAWPCETHTIMYSLTVGMQKITEETERAKKAVTDDQTDDPRT